MDRKEGKFNPLNMAELTRDAFRTLRMNISFSGGDKDVKTLVVTSTVPSEGKTSVSVGLGISMAESMKNTLIIECDCRRPSVGSRLKLRPSVNWIDVLYQHGTLEEAIVPTSVPNLYFLDAEPGLVHSVELLNSGRFREMVEKIKEHFDFIIFDTPPLGSFIDAAVLSEHADGAIIVINSGSREIRLLKEIVEQLKKANARILGVVLNRVNAHHSGYYKYGDYYYRNQGKSHSAKSGGSGKAFGEKASGRSSSGRKTGRTRITQSNSEKPGDGAESTAEDIGWEEYARNKARQAAEAKASATYRPEKLSGGKTDAGVRSNAVKNP